MTVLLPQLAENEGPLALTVVAFASGAAVAGRANPAMSSVLIKRTRRTSTAAQPDDSIAAGFARG
jgi:hypothetical protein